MNQPTIYALGFFDGVHLGHQALLRQCRQLADSMGCRAGVVTFLGHPPKLKKTPLINTAADRRRLLQSYGMDTVIELPFDKKLMKLPYMTFFRMLLHRYGAAGMVCGHDFRFGYQGEGNAEKLKIACAEASIPCVVVSEQTVNGITVSSTYIRTLLEQGQMEKATEFLGHPHIFTGTVVPGRHLGRTIGVPTANLVLPKGLLMPQFGVYACRTVIDGKTYPAVTNLGIRPTVEGWGVTVEPWILGFEGDLYGQPLTLEFHKYLRPISKFPSLEELRTQIHKDADLTNKFFEKYEK